MTVMDLNSDVGESFGAWDMGDDAAIFRSVSSANVACGFHAGDPLTLQYTCALAARHGVRVGAQVSYRDLAGFGRRFLDCSEDELRADVLYQLGALQAMCKAAGTTVASASGRPWTSSVPAFRPRSEITSRQGTPISSQSANIAPGRSPRSSSITSSPAAASSSCTRLAAAWTSALRS